MITGLYGFALYGVTALLPLFLQTLLGYSALDSGLAVSPRGLGAMASMVVVGVLVNYVDGRILLAFGLGILAYSTYLLGHINLGISMGSVALPNFLNGFAGGFIFVPLTTHDHEPPAQAGDRQRRRHLQPDAQYRRQHRHRRAHRSRCAARRSIRTIMGANLTASNSRSACERHSRASQRRFQAGGANAVTAHQEAMGAVYRSIAAASRGRSPMQTISACWLFHRWSASRWPRSFIGC